MSGRPAGLDELGRRLVAALALGDVTLGARDLSDIAGAYDPRAGSILVDPNAAPGDIALAVLDGLTALAADPATSPHARPRLSIVRDETG